MLIANLDLAQTKQVAPNKKTSVFNSFKTKPLFCKGEENKRNEIVLTRDTVTRNQVGRSCLGATGFSVHRKTKFESFLR